MNKLRYVVIRFCIFGQNLKWLIGWIFIHKKSLIVSNILYLLVIALKSLILRRTMEFRFLSISRSMSSIVMKPSLFASRSCNDIVSFMPTDKFQGVTHLGYAVPIEIWPSWNSFRELQNIVCFDGKDFIPVYTKGKLICTECNTLKV